jgi:hypothetical protein
MVAREIRAQFHSGLVADAVAAHETHRYSLVLLA